MKQCKMCGRYNEITNAFCVGCGKTLNLINPNKKQETIVQVGNFILFFLFYISILFILLVGILSIWIGLAPIEKIHVFLEKYFNGLIIVGIIALIIALVILIFNIVMGILMYKRNKENHYIGKYKMIKKRSYVLLILFLGQFGVHRFIIGDNKGGIIRVLALVVSFLIQFLFKMFSSIIIAIIFLLILVFIRSLRISDIVIGLSKVSNEDKMISI